MCGLLGWVACVGVDLRFAYAFALHYAVCGLRWLRHEVFGLGCGVVVCAMLGCGLLFVCGCVVVRSVLWCYVAR